MQTDAPHTFLTFQGGEAPKLQDVKLVSDGWIKKYVLTYLLPGGQPYTYEAVSRKGIDEYRAALLRNGEQAGDRGDSTASAPTGADAVCIVPVLPDGSIVLIREFRYAVNGWLIALPAGLLEPGETVIACVERELMEETGYRVRHDVEGCAVKTLPQNGYSSAGMGEESVCVAIAQVEPGGAAHPEHSELIETFVLPRADIGTFLDRNRDLIGTRCQLLLEAICCQTGEHQLF